MRAANGSVRAVGSYDSINPATALFCFDNRLTEASD